jgi:hypothetical protein
MRRWLLIALLAAACGKSGDKPNDKPTPASDKSTPPPTDEGELEPTPVEPEPKPDPPKPDPPKPDPKRGPAPLPSADACVKDCVQRNQMKATSPENIEADCKSECSQK